MNGPGSQIERRGATGSPDGGSSLLFFGGIVVGIALLGAGALAIWGPEKDVSAKAAKLASEPAPSESVSPFPSSAPVVDAVPAVGSEMVAPPADPPPEPAPADSAGKKGKKKPGGKGKKR